MSGFKKERHDPIELINKFWPQADVSHITYDPKMRRGEYNVIRQCSGDGTILFSIEMLQKGLTDIANGCSYFRRTEPNWEKVRSIKYTIGTMRHVTIYGMIKLKCSKTNKYQGQRERIRMPVKCEYVYT